MSDTPDTPTPAPEPQPAPVAAPSPLKAPSSLRPPASPAPVAKISETFKFVLLMSSIEHADDSIPSFLPIVAGFAAAVAVAFAVLLYLKH